MKKLIILLSMILISLVACQTNEDASSETNEDENGTNQSGEPTLWETIQEEGEMTVATSGTLIAASYYDDNDELTGYDVEVMREIANRLGVDVNFEIMGIDGMLPAIDSGRIDVAANDIEVTDNRKEAFDFSDPYKYSYSTMVVRESDYSDIYSLEDLEGKIAGGGATTIYSQIAEHFGAEVKTYGNAGNEAYLSDVSNGRSDVVINDYYLIRFGVAAFPDFDIMIHPDLKFHPTEQAVVMKKGETDLQQAINAALSEMREDGTLTEIAERFYQQDASKQSEEEIEEIDGLDI